MGIWADIAGIGAGIAGFAAAPFTGGASIPAGLAAAGSLVGAGLQSDAVSSAAKAQQDAANKALTLQQTMYNTTRSDLSPYASIGNGALMNLRQLAGIPAAASAPASGVPQSIGSFAKTPPAGAPIVGTAVPRGTVSPNGTDSGYVTLRAPNGSTKAVPMNEVPHWVSLGAQIMGGS